MSSFTNAFPTFEKLNDGRNGYRLTESFQYYTIIIRRGLPLRVTITVHDQFYTDLMSGPEWLKDTIGLKREDYAAASILHDHLYRYRIARTVAWCPLKLTRKECDHIMKEAMLVLLNYQKPKSMKLHQVTDHAHEVDKIRTVYSILRTWGWVAWLKWRFKGLFS